MRKPFSLGVQVSLFGWPESEHNANVHRSSTSLLHSGVLKGNSDSIIHAQKAHAFIRPCNGYQPTNFNPRQMSSSGQELSFSCISKFTCTS